MGIGITGISKARLVACSRDYVEGEYDMCLEEHYTVDPPSRGRDRVKPGCYVAVRGGRTFSLNFSHGGYSGWIRRLITRPRGGEALPPDTGTNSAQARENEQAKGNRRTSAIWARYDG